nr:reverse transcriptase domain-containing protein [Tanacetum cinerariifolium]
MFWKKCKAYTTHEFDALLAVLRRYRPDGVQKLENAGFDKWLRAYCPANHFIYMTSNSVEYVNSLSRFVRKLPITRLVEYFRGLLQRWYCEKRQKCEDASTDELTPLAVAKVKDMMLKIQSCRVNDIDALKIYQGFDNKSVHEAQPWFMNNTLTDTYRELVYPLKDASIWEAPNDLQQVLPPLMLKQPTGRPKNTNRILSRGETPSQARCETKVKQYTHHEEPLTREALLDEERLRNGMIYQDWDDLVQEVLKTSRKRRSNVNSCPPQILPIPLTENFIGLREWDGPAEWMQYSYNPMNNFMPTAGYSSNNTLNSMLNDVTEAPSTVNTHPHKSTMSPTLNVPDKTSEDLSFKMWKGDGSTSLNTCGSKEQPSYLIHKKNSRYLQKCQLVKDKRVKGLRYVESDQGLKIDGLEDGFDPMDMIKGLGHYSRNLGEPSSLFEFEEVMSIPHNNQGPPPTGPPSTQNISGPPPVVRPNGPAPRSMEELCQPPINRQGGPIAPIPIQATDFRLRHHMIQQVQNSCQFHGLPGDDANRHIDKILEITQYMKQNGVSDDALHLSLFPYSLTYHATAWYDRLLRNSIHTFDDMMRKFLSKYFPPSMDVECETEATKDKVQATSSKSTAHIQPSVVQVTIPEPEDAPKPNPKPSIHYPSRLNDQNLHALLHMPKFASTFKSLLSNKENLFELASTLLNENCSAVLLKKLPKKLRDPDKFLIPCDFSELEECLALADHGASINIMPLSVWKKLSLPELTPTCMTLKLANRSVSIPVDVAEDVFVKVGKFYFLSDFVVVYYDVNPRFPLILGRPFLRKTRALIDVHRIRIDVIDVSCEEYAQEVLRFLDSSMSGNPTPSDPIIASSSPSFTPFKGNGFILEEIETFLQDDFNLAVQHQRRVNLKIHKVIKKKVIKLLDAGLIYPISDSPWVSPVHCVPKKGGITVIENEDNESIPTRLVTGWRMDFLDIFKFPLTRKTKRRPPLLALVVRLPTQACLSAYVMLRARSKVLSKTILYTDHSALKYLLAKQDAKLRLLRWILLLQEFDVIIRDKKGAENLAADHLSRLENPHEGVLEKKEITETFPLETLGMISLHGDSSTSCDRVTHFCNYQFAKVMLKYGVTYRLSTAYHPQTSRQVEVLNRCLKHILERTVGENRALWSDKLDDALRDFRTAFKTPTRCTPYKLVYGKACHLPIELEHKAYLALKHCNFDLKTAVDHRKVQMNELNELQDQAYENSLIYKEKTKKIHDSNIKNRIFNVGDRVLHFNSRLKIFSGKLKTPLDWIVHRCLSFPYGTIELSQTDGPNFKVNGHRLKHYFRGDIPPMVVLDI